MFEKNKLILLIVCLSLLIGQISAANLQGSTETTKVFETQEYVNVGPNKFFEYSVYSTSDGNIQIDILDQNLNTTILTFDKQNKLYFRVAYYNFVIVEQKNETHTINYWIIEVVYTDQGFVLISFSVSSRVDNQGFQLDGEYMLVSILEYNLQDNFLCVNLQSQNDTDIYGIDLAKQTPFLIAQSWFYYDKEDRQVIVGGNSRVLVIGNKDQIWVDTRNVRKDDADQTIFNKTKVYDLAKIPVYPGGSQAYNLIDTYFQYISISQDMTRMSGFVYHGYGDQPLQGEMSMNSPTQIMFFSDAYNYFIAVGGNDILMTIVDYNEATKQYTVFSNTLANTISNADVFTSVLSDFSSAIYIVYNNQHLYILSQEKFFVYGNQPTYFTKLYQHTLDQPVTSNQYQKRDEVIFEQIKKYTQMNLTASGKK